jgi:hypothetical protein
LRPQIGARNRTFGSRALLLAPEQSQLPQRIGIIVERQAVEAHSPPKTRNLERTN